ncbi:MAG: O-antigen ligase family protein [Gammaproteobacteria bacterium]|nr:O-antigen ligase family protein [Gammaproteobacteria bacterium]
MTMDVSGTMNVSTVRSGRGEGAARKGRSAYHLYWCLAATLIVFFIYVYGQVVFPAFGYAKDFLLIVVAIATLLDVLRCPFRWQPNRIDLCAGLLFLYLLLQLVYTAVRVESLPVAYLGFRLDFMPIILYFGFRRLEGERYWCSLHRLFLVLLVMGAVLTLIEFVLTAGGFVGSDFFLDLLAGPEASSPKGERVLMAFGDLPRIYGITGTPHITGVYHLVLLVLLLYWPLPSRGQTLPVPSLRLGSLALILLLLLAVAATMLSTSKTAWVILAVMLALLVLSQRRIDWKGIVLVAVVLAFLTVLVFGQEEANKEFLLSVQFLGFLEIYYDLVSNALENVLEDSPVFGYGYEYDMQFSSLEADNVTEQNQPLQSDIYFAEVFRMLGGAGLALFAILFGVLPLQLLFSRCCSREGKGAALGVLAIFLAFAHYSPLTSPVMASAAWYLLAYMSREWSLSLRGHPTFRKAA